MDQYDNKDVVSQFGIMDPELEKVRTREYVVYISHSTDRVKAA